MITTDIVPAGIAEQTLNEALTGIITDKVLRNGLMERYDRAIDRYRNLNSWYKNSPSAKLSLPYHNWRTWHETYQISSEAYRDCLLLKSAIEIMISYVVSDQVTYAVNPRRTYTATADELKKVTRSVEYTSSQDWWHQMQEESVLRYFRDGEYFRRIFVDDSKDLVIRFVEPFNIKTDPQIEVERDDFRDGLGIIHSEGDAVDVIGYWVRKLRADGRGDEYKEVPADQIQHAKHGVDSNDPRGIGLGYMAYCHLMQHKEVSEAMVELALVQASYAAVRVYDTNVRNDLIDGISKKDQQVRDENAGRPRPGQVVDAKGFRIELLGANIDAAGFIEILSQVARQVGLLLTFPEFLITADADTGNRSSLVSAEGPFDRRVRREQTGLGNHDVDLLWKAVQINGGVSDAGIESLKKRIQIVPQFQSAATRDADKEVQSVISQVAARLLSVRSAIARLSGNPDQEIAQIKKETEQNSDPAAGLAMFLNPGQRVAQGQQTPTAAANVPSGSQNVPSGSRNGTNGNAS